jgi:hypothetical protein
MEGERNRAGTTAASYADAGRSGSSYVPTMIKYQAALDVGGFSTRLVHKFPSISNHLPNARGFRLLETPSPMRAIPLVGSRFPAQRKLPRIVDRDIDNGIVLRRFSKIPMAVLWEFPWRISHTFVLQSDRYKTPAVFLALATQCRLAVHSSRDQVAAERSSAARAYPQLSSRVLRPRKLILTGAKPPQSSPGHRSPLAIETVTADSLAL